MPLDLDGVLSLELASCNIYDVYKKFSIIINLLICRLNLYLQLGIDIRHYVCMNKNKTH